MASAHAQRLAAVMANNELATAQAQNTATLNAGYDQAKTDLSGNINSGLDAIQTGQDQALSAIGSGYDAAKGYYTTAQSYYQPYADAGTKALSVYEDATGVNGATGGAAATAAFQASPGYQYSVDQATDATARKAASLGIAGSGNTLTAINTQAQNLANQDYDQYVSNLQNLTQLGYGATNAQAGLEKGIGDLSASEGTAQAGVDTTSAASKAGLYTTLGTGLSGLDTGLATNLSSQNLQVASAMGSNGMQAGAATDAAKNANENLLLGLGGLGVNLLTGGKGTGLLSSLGKLTNSSSPYIDSNGTSWT